MFLLCLISKAVDLEKNIYLLYTLNGLISENTKIFSLHPIKYLNKVLEISCKLVYCICIITVVHFVHWELECKENSCGVKLVYETWTRLLIP